MIFLDQKDAFVATIRASGARMIVSSVVLTLLKYFVFGYALDEAINEPRFHHQLVPDVVCVQEDFLTSGGGVWRRGVTWSSALRLDWLPLMRIGKGKTRCRVR